MSELRPNQTSGNLHLWEELPESPKPMPETHKITAMVEVFKTNVIYESQAILLSGLIAQAIPCLKVNFDLDDCDHILRIELSGRLDNQKLIGLLRDHGFHAEELTDDFSTPSLFLTDQKTYALR